MPDTNTFDPTEVLQPQLWVSRHADYLYSYALSRLDDDQTARDLVQETFLAALEKISAFRGDSSERTWLTAILKFKVIDVYRKRSRAAVNVEPPTEFFESETEHWKKEHWPQPFGVEDHDPLHNKEFMNVLQKCMQRLPPLWLSVFRLKHLDDEGTAEICAALKLSSANYWVIIHRAKVNLRSCLQKNWL